MRYDNGTSIHRRILLLAVVGGLLLLGCGAREDLVAPAGVVPSVSEAVSTASATGMDRFRKSTGRDDQDGWRLVATAYVIPAAPATVTGSRYTLTFQSGSVSRPETITIREHDPLVVDVELGPHGTRFIIPVQVTIDYAGTANDPDMPNYNGLEPKVYWHDDANHVWREVPSIADEAGKTVTFYLKHFSRYAMPDGISDDEWQWTRPSR